MNATSSSFFYKYFHKRTNEKDKERHRKEKEKEKESVRSNTKKVHFSKEVYIFRIVGYYLGKADVMLRCYVIYVHNFICSM